MAAYETGNDIWGKAKNIWNGKRSPGGSSGGEGGLIASHGSPLGIGTDIGGSIRIPAAFNGCYGFKPSPLRCSILGMHGMDGRKVYSFHSFIITSLVYLNRFNNSIKWTFGKKRYWFETYFGKLFWPCIQIRSI